MLLCAREDGVERALEPFADEAPRGLDGERLRGVEHVRGGEAEVEPAAVLAEGLRDRVDERRDVVVRLPLEPATRSGARRMRDRAHPLDRGRRHDADRIPAVEGRQLDLEHATEPSPRPTRSASWRTRSERSRHHL